MTMTTGLGGISGDPGMDPMIRRAFGRLATPHLICADEGVTINDEGKFALRLDGSSLSQGADGVRINPAASPTVSGLTIGSLTGVLSATAGVVSATIDMSPKVKQVDVVNVALVDAETGAIYSYFMPSGTLSSNKSSFDFIAHGACTGTIKISVSFDGISLFTAADVTGATNWSLRGTIYRSNSTSFNSDVTIIYSNGAVVISSENSALSLSPTASYNRDITLSIEKTSTAASSSVTGHAFRVVMFPAPA